MTRLPKIILSRIDEVRAGSSTHLDLHNAGLQEIPEEVFGLPKLEELNLRNNNIHAVPARIRELTKLKVINLWGNPIKTVPDIFGLYLEWDPYLRLRKNLSSEHVVAIDIVTSEHEDEIANITKVHELLPILSELTALRTLSIGPRELLMVNLFCIVKPEARIGLIY